MRSESHPELALEGAPHSFEAGREQVFLRADSDPEEVAHSVAIPGEDEDAVVLTQPIGQLRGVDLEIVVHEGRFPSG